MRALSIVLVSFSAMFVYAAAQPSSASAEGCNRTRCTAPRITSDEIAEHLNDLLKGEGLPATRASAPVVMNIELDGDPATAEAIVTVVSAEHCIAGACTSIVVKRDCSGALVTIGHGTWVTPLASSTNGWLDLASSALGLVPSRALKFANGRYS